MEEQKPSYDELEKKYNDLQTKMYSFFGSKVVTKLPFGDQSKPFLIEVLISKETYKQIIMYHEVMDALSKCKIKDIKDAPPEIQERMRREAEENTNKKMEAIEQSN